MLRAWNLTPFIGKLLLSPLKLNFISAGAVLNFIKCKKRQKIVPFCCAESIFAVIFRCNGYFVYYKELINLDRWQCCLKSFQKFVNFAQTLSLIHCHWIIGMETQEDINWHMMQLRFVLQNACQWKLTSSWQFSIWIVMNSLWCYSHAWQIKIEVALELKKIYEMCGAL